MLQLTEAGNDAIKAFEDSAERGLALSELQSAATHSASQLVDTLARLTVDTQHEFKKINVSISELQKGLAPQTSWMKNGLVRLVEVVMRGEIRSFASLSPFVAESELVEPDSLKHLDQALVIRVLSFLCSLWFQFFHSLASSLMVNSALILMTSVPNDISDYRVFSSSCTLVASTSSLPLRLQGTLDLPPFPDNTFTI